jgi:transcriptional regulator with XRE-family HTH domain
MGKRIVAEANRLGLAIDEVAEAAGVSRPTLYRILSGRIGSPRLQTVLAIAAALRTPASRLIGKGA